MATASSRARCVEEIASVAPRRPASSAWCCRRCRTWASWSSTTPSAGCPVRRAGRQRQREGRLHRRGLGRDAARRRRALRPGRPFRAPPVPRARTANWSRASSSRPSAAGPDPDPVRRRNPCASARPGRPNGASRSSWTPSSRWAAPRPWTARSSPTSRSGRSAPAGPPRPEQAQAVHAFIRGEIAARDARIAGSLPILYGGSVKPDNAAGAVLAARRRWRPGRRRLPGRRGFPCHRRCGGLTQRQSSPHDAVD